MRNDRQTRSTISREAAEWCITMGSGEASRDEKMRFAEWITRSPHHLREYAAIETLWEEAAAFGNELRRDARVVSLFPGKRGKAEERKRPASARRLVMTAAVVAASLIAGIVLVGGGWKGLVQDDPVNVYQTMKGETRVISLADGSVMHLNTTSQATVHYDQRRRFIFLDRGQAYFDVRKNPDRPFVVATDSAEVEAVGTGFDVKAFGGELAVTVVEGEVVVRAPLHEKAGGSMDGSGGGSGAAVSRQDGARQTVWSTSLVSNQQIVLSARYANRPPQPKAVAAHAETAWRENKLIFDGDPLAEVVADFNRYNTKYIVLLDKDLGALRVSGSFDPRDPEAFAETIAAAVGLTVQKGLENRAPRKMSRSVGIWVESTAVRR